MKILAIDTSSVSGSIAITEDGRTLSELNTERVGTHSEWLLPSIERLLGEAEMTPSDVDVFALSIGPGSFTGLRIGVSVLKGLSWGVGKEGGGKDIPIVGVSTLEALALGLTGNTAYGNALIVPILDARKKDVYSACFELSDEGQVRRLSPDVVTRPETLIEELNKRKPKGVLFLGLGLSVYAKMMEDLVDGAVILGEPFWNVDAKNVATIAELAIEEQGIEAVSVGAEQLTPLYIRRSDVEFKKTAVAD